MRIEYQNSIEDVLHFSQYHSKFSPTAKKRMNLSRYGFPILFLVVLMPAIIMEPLGNLTLWFVISLTWFIILPGYHLYSTKRRTLKMYKEGKNKALFAKHVLELTDEGIIEDSDYSRSVIKWAAIERIEKDDRYIYMYVSALSAFIIPLNSFQNEDSTGEYYNKLKSLVK